jgi:hypothetical protein
MHIFCLLQTVISHDYCYLVSKKHFTLSLISDFNNMLQQQQSQASPVPSKVRRLALAPIRKGVKLIMTYSIRLKPWVVAVNFPICNGQLSPDIALVQMTDGHVLLLRQRVPNVQFKVVFELSSCKE